MLQTIKAVGLAGVTLAFLAGCSNNYQLAANSLLLADWAQTRYIADSTEFYEKNTALGKAPTTGDVNRHFVATVLVINVLGEYIIPDQAKDYFYIGITTAEGLNVINNYRIGIKLKF